MVLGNTGRNFAAGMSGGIAYVWDKNGDFKSKCNMGMVELFPVKEQGDIKELKTLIENHARYSDSSVARNILENWDKALTQFIKIYPTDYRRVLEEAAAAKEEHVEDVPEGELVPEAN